MIAYTALEDAAETVGLTDPDSPLVVNPVPTLCVEFWHEYEIASDIPASAICG